MKLEITRDEFGENDVVLEHHGIKGQKWYVRRFQNEDGTLTEEGRKRYGRISAQLDKEMERNNRAADKTMSDRSKRAEKISGKYDKKISDYDKKIEKLENDIRSYDPIKDGLTDTKGRAILTKDDVQSSVDSLQEQQNKLKAERDKVIAKKDEVMADFNLGTQFVQDGYNKYNQIVSDYKDATLKAFTDSTYSKDPAYEKAVKDYTAQVLSNRKYGYSAATVLNYASEIGRDYYNKNGKSS